MNIQKNFTAAGQKKDLTALPHAFYKVSYKLDGLEGVSVKHNLADKLASLSRASSLQDQMAAMEEWTAERENLIGKYSFEHGVLAFCDEQGQMYATPYSEDAKALLHSSNYKEVHSENFYDFSLFANFTNGYGLLNKGKNVGQKLFDPRYKKAYDVNGAANTLFEGAAKKADIKPLPLDIYDYAHQLNDPENSWAPFIKPAGAFKTQYDSGFKERADMVGKYGLEHGVISFCDTYGEVYVIKYSKDAETTLQSAGFRQINHENFYKGSLNAQYVNYYQAGKNPKMWEYLLGKDAPAYTTDPKAQLGQTSQPIPENI